MQSSRIKNQHIKIQLHSYNDKKLAKYSHPQHMLKKWKNLQIKKNHTVKLNRPKLYTFQRTHIQLQYHSEDVVLQITFYTFSIKYVSKEVSTTTKGKITSSVESTRISIISILMIQVSFICARSFLPLHYWSFHAPFFSSFSLSR